jgi:hypothetical protein
MGKVIQLRPGTSADQTVTKSVAVPRLIHGDLYGCQEDTPYSCPYELRAGDGAYCKHPNSLDHTCLKKRNNYSKGL